MVLQMMLFMRAVHTGNWALHLSSLQKFTQHFFAHDRLNYARMIPLYLAEMNDLPVTDETIYGEFLQGNWVVNKNENVAFCAVGADHALEHLNRSMKVSGGLVSITLNESARTKFFLTSPELSRLATEAERITGVTTNPTQHHRLSPTYISNEEKAVTALTSTFRNYTNPFREESNQLFNLATKVVAPLEVQQDICCQDAIGKELFEEFVEERIKSSNTNLWSPMRKRKLQTWKTMEKRVNVQTEHALVELKEDRSLFARLLLMCQSRPEIDLEEVISKYEFSVVPHALFAADGTMLHCSAKGNLLDILANKDPAPSTPVLNTDPNQPEKTVAIVDAMAEIQSMGKPQWIKTCTHLAEHFTARMVNKYGHLDEFHLVFDQYDVPLSLKTATRVQRQGNEQLICYHITDSTNIGKVPLKRLLAHTDTKKELTSYLAEKMLTKGKEEHINVVVAWSNNCEASHRDAKHLASTQEEADTKILLHAVDASSSGATSLQVHSPDTDVLVLSLRRHPRMCADTSFLTIGQNKRDIPLGPIVETLGAKRTAALPAFHALTGADITGCFSGKGKWKCWQAFMEASDTELEALANLGVSQALSTEVQSTVEWFVCRIYAPKAHETSVKDLRWKFFKKNQKESEKLPPTQAALHQAILHAQYQMMIWNNDIVPNPSLPSPEGYGWTLIEQHWVPIMTKELPAPESVIHLVKCKCAKMRCTSNRCRCKAANLNCTDLCECSDNDKCENTVGHEYMLTESDESDDSDDA